MTATKRKNGYAKVALWILFRISAIYLLLQVSTIVVFRFIANIDFNFALNILVSIVFGVQLAVSPVVRPTTAIFPNSPACGSDAGSWSDELFSNMGNTLTITVRNIMVYRVGSSKLALIDADIINNVGDYASVPLTGVTATTDKGKAGPSPNANIKTIGLNVIKPEQLPRTNSLSNKYLPILKNCQLISSR